MTKEISLTQNKVTLIDDRDYEWLSGHRWYAEAKRRRDGSVKTWYAARKARGVASRAPVYMHREILAHHGILDPGDYREVDHRNGDGIDNQIENLRPATIAENQHNRRKLPSGTSSRFKGVSLHARGWQAKIKVNNKSRHLGYYITELEAAQAYDIEARAVFGKFANCNFPLVG